MRGDLQQAISELRFAADRARHPKPKRRSRQRTFFVLGAIAAFAFLNPVTGPPLRAKISNLFSGRSEPELDYGA